MSQALNGKFKFNQTGYYCTCLPGGKENTKSENMAERLVTVDREGACTECGHYARYGKIGTIRIYAKTGNPGLDRQVEFTGIEGYEEPYGN